MATKEVKSEGWGGDSDDDNVPISAINRSKKKKVEDSDDDDDELPLAASRAKKKSADGKKGGGLKGNAVPSKVKKEQSQDSKEDVKKKKVKKENNSKGKENSSGNVKKEKVKRVYELPGQKHDPPEERDPLRIFYETLYEQVPNSEMAAFWMMEQGLLPEDEAEKVFKKKKQKGILSPSKPTLANKLPGSNTAVKRSLDTCSSTEKGKTGISKDSAAKSKKRKADSDSEEDSDDDFVDAPKINPRKRRKVSN